MKFSVVVPTHNRVLDGLLHRALMSVLSQTYKLWECIVVDDGSNEPVDKVVEAMNDFRFKLVRHEKRRERLVAWNSGFKAATGEWICMLCSDDIYLPHYLQVLDQAMKVYPDAMVFNFQEMNIRGDAKVWVRPLFTPKRLEKGHEPFRSGKISMGNFIFKKECLDVVGMYPETNNYWKFSEMTKERFPFLREYFPGTKEIGNPWGEDFMLFLAISREFTSIPLPVVIYGKYPQKAGKIRFDEFEQKRLKEEMQ
jgi:glycosyltransferase involved in cell wall biosynthesis